MVDTVQMRFGDVTFSLDTQQYETFSENHRARVSEIAVNGGVPLIHHNGFTTEVSLSGVRFPLDQGVDGADAMRALIRAGEPHIFTDALLQVWGEYMATGLEIESSKFVAGNVPARQSFTLSLKLYRV